MSTLLGKRKRRTDLHEAQDQNAPEDSEAVDRLRSVLQAHFEASYEPLNIEPIQNPTSSDNSSNEPENDDDEDAWSGISDDTSPPPPIEIVTHNLSTVEELMMTKAERKAFMTSKPPPPPLPSISNSTTQTTLSKTEAETEATLRASDLELQKLLRESHLLSPSSTTPTGSGRHKASDLHLTSSLGAKSSLFEQKSMPSHIRKGITAKKVKKEKYRREEAKREGVVLERFGRKEIRKRKVGGFKGNVGGPGVGKWTNGGATLKLSGKDVRDIVGSSNKGGFKGKKGGGKKRR